MVRLRTGFQSKAICDLNDISHAASYETSSKHVCCNILSGLGDARHADPGDRRDFPPLIGDVILLLVVLGRVGVTAAAFPLMMGSSALICDFEASWL
jgi:hypothetical protein